eukprot:3154951-Lingulodinium_polyedra.AAC.1
MGPRAPRPLRRLRGIRTSPANPSRLSSKVAAAWNCAARRPAPLGTVMRSHTLRLATTSACSPTPCRTTFAPAG